MNRNQPVWMLNNNPAQPMNVEPFHVEQPNHEAELPDAISRSVALCTYGGLVCLRFLVFLYIFCE